MIKYRVIIKVGYQVVWFEFEQAAEAIAFASTALQTMVDSEDTKKKAKITIEIIDPNIEKEEDD